jgi:hypothetical protein
LLPANGALAAGSSSTATVSFTVSSGAGGTVNGSAYAANAGAVGNSAVVAAVTNTDVVATGLGDIGQPGGVWDKDGRRYVVGAALENHGPTPSTS